MPRARTGYLKEAAYRISRTDLEKVVILYRDRNLSLWGIPYKMRPGQSPKDIAEKYHDAWIWLGSPGWYGNMTPASQRNVQEFLAAAEAADCVPGGFFEWQELEACPVETRSNPIGSDVEWHTKCQKCGHEDITSWQELPASVKYSDADGMRCTVSHVPRSGGASRVCGGKVEMQEERFGKVDPGPDL